MQADLSLGMGILTLVPTPYLLPFMVILATANLITGH